MQVDRSLAGRPPPRQRRQRRAGRTRARRGAFWALLGDDVEPLRTEYDVERAAAAIRATGYPDADDHAAQLLEPPAADEVSAYFESLRGA